jgi:hypothetical protein
MCVNTVNGADNFSDELFRRLAYLDGLRHSETKVFCLLDEASGCQRIRLGRVNKVQSKQVFLLTSTHVKAVAVVRWIRYQSAIFQHNPIFRSILCAKVNRRARNDNNRNERAYTNSRQDRKAKDQSGTSNWLMILNT